MITILGIPYKIIISDDLAVDENYWGAVSYSKQEIKVDKFILNTPKMGEILLHEIFHVVFEALRQKIEEKDVHCISSVFYAVMKDNPNIFKFNFENVIDKKEEDIKSNINGKKE